MRVLGIETSCDDTGVAVYDDETRAIQHRLSSQVALHAPFGGVVPEIASRDHVRTLLPLIARLLGDLGLARTDAIAYTEGPGLVGALLVGGMVAQSLAFAWDVPAIGVHHLEGHLLAPMLDADPPAFPFLALLVSGGHTLLMDVAAPGAYTRLGESLDDAAGEAFDKLAKIMGLGYPGGPAIEALARSGNPERYRFARPLLDRPGLDFSFSGLKTQVAGAVHREGETAFADIAASFQAAVIDTLIAKAGRALDATGRTRLVIAGGVGANRALREALAAAGAARGVRVYYPRPEFCTDNGAMIAYAGSCRLRSGQATGLAFEPRARWPLETLVPL